MKKRIIVLTAILAFILTGCGNAEFKDPNAYYSLFKDKINEIDEEFIPTLTEMIETMDVSEQIETFEENYINDYNEIFTKTKKADLKEYYDDFKSDIEEATDLEDLGIYTTVEDLEDTMADFEEYSAEIKKAAQKFYQDTLDVYNTALEDAGKIIKDSTVEELEDEYYGFNDLMNEQMDKVEDKLDNIYDEFYDALWDSI